MSWPSVPDDPSIATYGQDAGYCEICEQHLDSGRCPGHCENESCEHLTHCIECGTGLDYQPVDNVCAVCYSDWLAGHQLTFSGPDHNHRAHEASALGSENSSQSDLSEIRKLVDEVGPEAAGLCFVLNKLEKYLRPESGKRYEI